MSLKLFVWENVLRDYTPGIMFALANDVDEARVLPPTHIIEAPAGFVCWGGG